ncbi:TIGR03617 family F420-dependent LLM class oxidoreductase [Blastococcus sp. SYSU D00820]
MLLDAMLPSAGFDGLEATARDLEARGFTGAWSAEVDADPFLPLLVAGRATTRLQVGTSIAVAFARSPMTVASTAWDLQRATGGRFVLGLGTQVRAHVERRFSMPWTPPVPRMREYVAALRAIWTAWAGGDPLRFTGEHYRHTLMTPTFTPPPHRWGAPPVYLAAVGPAMTRLAGEVADGLLAHAFTTARYLRERTLPALEEGLAAAGRDRSQVAVSLPGFVVTGRTPEERAQSATRTRERIAFYGSTPAYRPVLELHGWGALADELHALSVSRRDDRWTAMRDLVDDAVLDAFAVVGEPEDVGPALLERFGGLVDRFSVPAGGGDLWDPVLAAVGRG